MICRPGSKLKFYILSKENAQEVLSALGYGNNDSKAVEDGRYGIVTNEGIEFGYATSTLKYPIATIKFGKYVIPKNEYGDIGIIDEDDFYDLYEIVESKEG